PPAAAAPSPLASRPGPQTGRPPWVLFGVVGGSAAMLGALLVVVLWFVRGGGESPSEKPAARTGAGASHATAAAGPLRLSQLTVEIVAARAKAAGFDVLDNGESRANGMRSFHVSLAKGSKGAYVMVFHCEALKNAEDLERSYVTQDDSAVQREDRDVVV